MFCINKWAENRNAIAYIQKTTKSKIRSLIDDFQKKQQHIQMDDNKIFEALEITLRLRMSLKYS